MQDVLFQNHHGFRGKRNPRPGSIPIELVARDEPEKQKHHADAINACLRLVSCRAVLAPGPPRVDAICKTNLKY